MNKLNIDKSYRITIPHIVIRKGESSFLSLHFQIMSKNIPLNLNNYTVGFRGRDSVGKLIKENKIVVKDSKNGIIEVVLSVSDIKNTGEFQVAYLLIMSNGIADTTGDIAISVLDSVEGWYNV